MFAAELTGGRRVVGCDCDCDCVRLSLTLKMNCVAYHILRAYRALILTQRFFARFSDGKDKPWGGSDELRLGGERNGRASVRDNRLKHKRRIAVGFDFDRELKCAFHGEEGDIRRQVVAEGETGYRWGGETHLCRGTLPFNSKRARRTHSNSCLYVAEISVGQISYEAKCEKLAVTLTLVNAASKR